MMEIPLEMAETMMSLPVTAVPMGMMETPQMVEMAAMHF